MMRTWEICTRMGKIHDFRPADSAEAKEKQEIPYIFTGGPAQGLHRPFALCYNASR